MSSGCKFAIILITIAVLLALYIALAPEKHFSDEISFEAGRGDVVEVFSQETVHVVGESQEYFRISDGKNYIDGNPVEASSRDFFGEGDLNGLRLEVLDGSAAFTLTAAEPVYVIVHESPAEGVIFVFVFACLWILAVAVLKGVDEL